MAFIVKGPQCNLGLYSSSPKKQKTKDCYLNHVSMFVRVLLSISILIFRGGTRYNLLKLKITSNVLEVKVKGTLVERGFIKAAVPSSPLYRNISAACPNMIAHNSPFEARSFPRAYKSAGRKKWCQCGPVGESEGLFLRIIERSFEQVWSYSSRQWAWLTSPYTHSKSMSWDPHSDRLFLLLRLGQLLPNIFITMPLRSLCLSCSSS